MRLRFHSTALDILVDFPFCLHNSDRLMSLPHVVKNRPGNLLLSALRHLAAQLSVRYFNLHMEQNLKIHRSTRVTYLTFCGTLPQILHPGNYILNVTAEIVNLFNIM